jgi:hypothetical protein
MGIGLRSVTGRRRGVQDGQAQDLFRNGASFGFGWMHVLAGQDYTSESQPGWSRVVDCRGV